MTYLALYACSKLGFAIPYVMPRRREQSSFNNRPDDTHAAAPPLWILIIPLVPVTTATYVAASRFSDHRHHGFDIVFGSLLGFMLAWFGFRMYQTPLGRSGHSWAPRDASKALYSSSDEHGWRSGYDDQNKVDSIEV